MKHIKNRVTALLIGAVLSAGYLPAMSAAVSYADTAEKTEIKIIFDYEGEGITIEEDGVIEDIETTCNSSVFLPKAKLEREGATFTGWSADGIRGYEAGDVLRVNDKTEDIVLKPVWKEDSAQTKSKVTYSAHIGDEEIDLSKQNLDEKMLPGSIHTVTHFAVTGYGKKHIGWDYAGQYFRGDSKVVVPDHDIVFEAHWYEYRTMTYKAGDVEGIVGATFMELEFVETFSVDLPAKNRFSRKGYEITGWYCENDGKTYPLLSMYTMPMEDVVMYAVWEPINYAVVFNPDTGSYNDNIIVKGLTDTTIIVPECCFIKDGYIFKGWKFEDTIYQPGDEFYVKGQVTGLGIALKAVWETAPADLEIKLDASGDANCDGELSIADAVLIMQYMANPTKYGPECKSGISNKGLENADVVGNNGVTNADALQIQMYLLRGK